MLLNIEDTDHFSDWSFHILDFLFHFQFFFLSTIILLVYFCTADKNRVAHTASWKASPALHFLPHQLWQQHKEAGHSGDPRYSMLGNWVAESVYILNHGVGLQELFFFFLFFFFCFLCITFLQHYQRGAYQSTNHQFVSVVFGCAEYFLPHFISLLSVFLSVGSAWLPLLKDGRVVMSEQHISVASNLPNGYLSFQEGVSKVNPLCAVITKTCHSWQIFQPFADQMWTCTCSLYSNWAFVCVV